MEKEKFNPICRCRVVCRLWGYACSVYRLRKRRHAMELEGGWGTEICYGNIRLVYWRKTILTSYVSVGRFIQSQHKRLTCIGCGSVVMQQNLRKAGE